MSLEFGQIGYFQMVNLVQNKVPFHLVCLEPIKFEDGPADLAKLYDRALILNLASLVEDLKGKSIQLTDPIVLLCQTGVLSHKGARLLQEKGFINCYVVKDGLSGLSRS